MHSDETDLHQHHIGSVFEASRLTITSEIYYNINKIESLFFIVVVTKPVLSSLFVFAGQNSASKHLTVSHLVAALVLVFQWSRITALCAPV